MASCIKLMTQFMKARLNSWNTNLEGAVTWKNPSTIVVGCQSSVVHGQSSVVRWQC